MKLIGIDLDGTLLNYKNEISVENAEAIRYAQKKGIEVTIATGRSYFDVCAIAKKADITTHIIGNNGASIHFKKGKQIYSKGMDRKTVEESIKWLEQNGFYYEVSTNIAIYTPNFARQVIQVEMEKVIGSNPGIDTTGIYESIEKLFGQLGVVFVTGYKEILEKEEEFYNILAFSFDEEKRKFGMRHFEKIKTVSLFSSADYNFEMVNRETSKGVALERLAVALNITLNETMAIGDNYNDVSMLEKVKYSVAMKNAKEDIKDICRIVTKSNDENGVASAIYEFVNTAI